MSFGANLKIHDKRNAVHLLFCKQSVGAPSLYGIEEGGDVYLLNSITLDEDVALTSPDTDHYLPFILRDKSIVIASTEDAVPRINKLNYYDKSGTLTNTVPFDNDGFPNFPSYDEDMDLVFYSYSGGTYWDNGLVELSTGQVLAAKNLNQLYGQGRIVPGVGILAIKVVSAETFIALLDFDLNEVWSQTVEPHPQISGSQGAKAINVTKDKTQAFVAVSLANNDVAVMKINLNDGSYVNHTLISTKMVTGAQERMFLSEDDTIYVCSGLDSANGESHTIEVLNSDTTFRNFITLPSQSVPGYTGTGEVLINAGQSIEHLKAGKIFLMAWANTGEFPTPAFYGELDVNTDAVNLFTSNAFDYDSRDMLSVPGGRPYQHEETVVDLVPYPTVSLDANDDTTIDISWTYEAGEDIDGFDVYIDGVKDNGTQLPLGTTSYQFTGLTEQTNYLIHVKAIDSLGNESLFSNLVQVQTAETPPSPTAETFDSFSLGVLPTGYTQAAGSDLSWEVTDQRSKSGAQSLGSDPAIADNQTAAVEITVTYDSQDDIKFDYMPSTENNYDFFRFYIDGVLEFEQTGPFNEPSNGDTLTFDTFQKTLAAGTYTFKFEMAKDGSVSDYDDRCYIDNVDFFSGVIQ